MSAFNVKPFIRTMDRPKVGKVAELVVNGGRPDEQTFELTANHAVLMANKLMSSVAFVIPDLKDADGECRS